MSASMAKSTAAVMARTRGMPFDRKFTIGFSRDVYKRQVLFGFHRAIVGSYGSVQRIVELEGVMRVQSGKYGKRPFGYN